MSDHKAHPPSVEELAARAGIAVSARFPDRFVRNVAPLFGGSSSLTYSADLIGGRREERVVVKVAPPGFPPVRNRDVLRQARVLDVVAEAPGVAVPRVLGTDAGDPPDVPPLFVMTFVPGESLEPVFNPPGPAASDAEIEARALAAARMMARLHAVDPSPLGEHETVLAQEVGRWDKAFSTVDDDLRGGERAGLVRDELLKALPAPRPAAILHGDYRLGNMQCVGSTIGALIDWEIWSVGDPRLDLAWFLMNSDPVHPNGRGGGSAMPSAERLREEYQRASGRPVDELGFSAFYVVAGFPIAYLADRGVRRSIISAGIATWSLLTAVCGLAQNFWQLAAARFGVGVGQASSGPAGGSLLTDYFPRERRSTAFAIQSGHYASSCAALGGRD